MQKDLVGVHLCDDIYFLKGEDAVSVKAIPSGNKLHDVKELATLMVLVTSEPRYGTLSKFLEDPTNSMKIGIKQLASLSYSLFEGLCHVRLPRPGKKEFQLSDIVITELQPFRSAFDFEHLTLWIDYNQDDKKDKLALAKLHRKLIERLIGIANPPPLDPKSEEHKLITELRKNPGIQRPIIMQLCSHEKLRRREFLGLKSKEPEKTIRRVTALGRFMHLLSSGAGRKKIECDEWYKWGKSVYLGEDARWEQPASDAGGALRDRPRPATAANRPMTAANEPGTAANEPGIAANRRRTAAKTGSI